MFLTVILILSVATGCTSGRTTGTRQLGLAPATAAKLDAAIADAMREAKIPGATVGVWSADGDYVKAFGAADTTTGAPMRIDFYSRIGSVTKTFTATAVLQLADRGAVALDDPIANYIDGIPGGRAITVRQLANMRSGLPDYQENEEFRNTVLKNPGRDFTPGELLGWAFAQSPLFRPGQQYQYSNTNYILLGLLVEKISGKALPDYLTEHIFRPLGLAHTSFPTGHRFPDPHARGYTDPSEDGGAPVDATDWNASFTWAAGAIISTLDDMHAWLTALAHGRLLSPELQQQRGQSPPSAGLPAGLGYGLGIFIANGWIGHNGSVPGYQTVAIYLPQRTTAVVIMLNTDVTTESGVQPSTALGRAITTVLTPDHVYDV